MEKTKMITGVTFSKNRACQLHLFLESMDRNNKTRMDMNVLYDGDTEEFLEGYEILIKQFPNVNFVKQTDFKKDTLELCDSTPNELLMFFVDDNIMYRKFDLPNDFIKIYDYNVSSLSVRLGFNTVIQDPYTDSITIMPTEITVLEETFNMWNWTSIPGNMNFGYPFSVDGNVYEKEYILNIIKDFNYNNPNQFEGGFQAEWLTDKPYMACLDESVLVNTPLNLAGSSNNRAGEEFGLTLDFLNQQYLEGKKLDFDYLDFSNITCCHQELEMEWTQR